MLGWLRRLADESHESERVAERWHRLHAITYGLLILEYVAAIAWHLAAASRHRAAQPESARRADETDRQ